MAEKNKKFGIKGKIKPTKEKELPPKVSLTTQSKNLEAIKEQADKIHKEEPKVSPTPPKKEVKKEEKSKTTRLNVVLDRIIVKKIKMKVAKEETTIKDYITDLVEKDLGIK